ncbi:sodium:solute symporter family transporter [Peribacillus sp. TH27]|uniref:sodium:solute symporter family transporter n=1 Tax=Peribacillus sp. TH27 TaxID=2798484 RepID=UPI00313B11DC
MTAIWNSAVSIVINDLFKRYMVKNKSERFYINASRIAFLLIGASTLLFSLTFFGNVLMSLIYLSAFTGMLAFPIVAGFYWDKFNTKAAFFSMVSGTLFVSYALANGFPTYFISPIGVLVSFVVGIVVALTTKQDSSPEFLTSFYKAVGNPLFSNAYFFGVIHLDAIFPSQGRFCQGQAERGLCRILYRFSHGKGSSIKDESLTGYKRRQEVYSLMIGEGVHDYRIGRSY